MTHNRYGRFSFGDYKSAWLAITIMLAAAATVCLINLPHYLIIPLLGIAFVMAWSIYMPNRERFILSGDIITIINGGTKRQFTIPHEITLVLSYADAPTPLAKRVDVGNETFWLKDRYAVSIIRDVPLASALKRLHSSSAHRYFNSAIEKWFRPEDFLYSFVCNQSLLDQLISGRECLLIIPESLRDKISVDPRTVNEHIDMGY